ncbi:ATP-binding protein [Bremerella cremea]|uniref:ATP-binding protein n=1 Tax=Bremerella cremea TaxID=1031537 RepID=A0A368KRS9_9BACT|nr:ATP-binding protein [Bremerella cremea]
MESLQKAQLSELAKKLGQPASSVKKKAFIVDALASTRSFTTRQILESLRLIELKSLCKQLNLPVTDRKKSAYIEALLPRSNSTYGTAEKSSLDLSRATRSLERGSSKTLRSIRRGIRYQDLVAAESLIAMVTDDDSPPLWVMLENRAGGTFDDVVVGYPKLVVWKQVKWSQSPGSNPLSIQAFAERYGKRRTALISSFARSYRLITESGMPFELEIVSNRSLDSNFQRFVTGPRSRLKPKKELSKKQIELLAASWQELSGFAGDEFWLFLSSLHFHVNSPDLARLERDIERILKLLGCDHGAYERLIEAVWRWAQDDSKKRIDRTDVEAVLGGTAFLPPNEFILPEIRVTRAETQRELSRRIESIDNGYIVVLGSPGSGKSTLLNTFQISQSKPDNCDVVLYNCFTGTSDQFLRTRAQTDNFASFLARECYEIFPGQFGPRFNAGKSGIESLVSRAASCLSQGRKLVVIVDGIDYAQRYSSDSSQSLFHSLPVSLPPGIVFVLSARVMEQIPSHVRHSCGDEQIEVPPLDVQQVRDLLQQYGVIESLVSNQRDLEGLPYAVWSKSCGHALHTSIVAKQLRLGTQMGHQPARVLAEVVPYDGDIESYYALVLDQPRTALARDALGILAASPFELSSVEIARILDPPANPREVEDQLNSFAYLFRRIAQQWFFSHDSLRSFASRCSSAASFGSAAQLEFLSNLRDDPRTGEHLLHLLAEVGEGSFVASDLDCEWVVRQIVAGASIPLLHEGFRKLAITALAKEELALTSKYWILKGCLERAEFDGELFEANLVDAWLAQGRIDLVERYAYIASQFLSVVYPGPDLIELLFAHGYGELSRRLQDRILAQALPSVEEHGLNPEFEKYIQHLSLRASPNEIMGIVKEAIAGVARSNTHFVSPHLDSSRYASLAAYECLHHKEYARVDSWLQQDPLPFDFETAVDLWFRTRIALDELEERRDRALTLMEDVTDLGILLAALDIPDLKDSVRQRLEEFPLPNTLSDRYPWYDCSHARKDIIQLSLDIHLCNQLSLDSRLSEINALMFRQPSRVARAFHNGIAAIAGVSADGADTWKEGIKVLSEGIYLLAHTSYSSTDVQSASFFSCGLGEIVRPTLHQARKKGQLSEFESMIRTNLLPALNRAGIRFGVGILSLCDLFLNENCCRALAHELLEEVKGNFVESCEFKSGSLMSLNARYAKLGNLSAARRVLTNGVRASFTYGYRKDTAINDFIIAFELVGPLLGERLSGVAKFITQVLLLLDELTDGRMLYDAPSHFVAVLCRFDVNLAVHYGRILATRCRQLNMGAFSEALRDHNVNVKIVRAQFAREAPEVEVNAEEVDVDPRAYFVTSEVKRFPQVRDMKEDLLESILSSCYGSVFHKLPSVIGHLVNSGNCDAALKVFDSLEEGIRVRVSNYPIPEL